MPNLRIVSSNALDRSSSFSISSEALSKENLRDPRRSVLWRATTKVATISIQWAAAETIKCVCLPNTNFTTNATMQVRGFTEVGDASPAFSVGPMNCVRFRAANPYGFEALPAGINQYAYGGGTYAVLWFAGGAVKRLQIDISDTTNASNIEACSLVVGDYWSPKYNPTWGAGVTPVDTSKHDRAGSGDLVTDRGTRYRKMAMGMAQMPEADRAVLHNILRSNGIHRPMLVSLYPEDASAQLEWDHMIWCKLSQVSAIAAAQFAAFSNSIDLEEI